MITAKQKFEKFLQIEGRHPTIEEWKSWGYTREYYYKVKKQITGDSNVK